MQFTTTYWVNRTKRTGSSEDDRCAASLDLHADPVLRKLCCWRCACFCRIIWARTPTSSVHRVRMIPSSPSLRGRPVDHPQRAACRDFPRSCSAHLALLLLTSARVEGAAINGKAIRCYGMVIVVLLAAAAMSPCWKRGTCLSPTWLTLLILLQLHCSDGCSLQQPTAANLKDMLTEAMPHRQDDRVVFPGLAVNKFLTECVMDRPRLGENTTFHCRVPADVDWRHVSWVHQNWVVFEDGRPQPLPAQDITGQTYNFTHVNDTLTVVVRNVTMRSGGLLQCVIDPPYTRERRILQRFLILPLITQRRDVFAAADESNVTAIEGEEVTVQWHIRLPVPEGLLLNLPSQLMWVHQGRIVQGPWEAPYGLPMPAGEGPRDVEADYQLAVNSPGQLLQVEFHFRAVTLADGGSVQCWFRPHLGVHEWIVQTKTLLVLPRNGTQKSGIDPVLDGFDMAVLSR
ncbi:uncharacterized protein LOC129599147 isoform X2 [Paramacrobiotus metropolitanus]|uniref:uncharacterized protein LOC129599147 isoform X2 n=1 Tax=Paramacrobiotus metropolitanus TaxID=2943436 RepID=UPI002445FD0E|nr:uncharacterized protein LOC129599147 isoform X2 [Paramacrobiotus metropolitanus]